MSPSPRDLIREQKLAGTRRPYLMIALMVFGLLVIVAITADSLYMARHRTRPGDTVKQQLQDIVLGLDHPPFVDKWKLFSIVAPETWRTVRYPDCHPYNVSFIGVGADISVMATRVTYNDFATLLKTVKWSERRMNVDTHIETTNFLGRPAVRRTCRMRTSTVVSFDFVENYVAHHILCGMPPEHFEKYLPVMMDVMNTYKPLTPAPGYPPAKP